MALLLLGRLSTLYCCQDSLYFKGIICRLSCCFCNFVYTTINMGQKNLFKVQPSRAKSGLLLQNAITHVISSLRWKKKGVWCCVCLSDSSVSSHQFISFLWVISVVKQNGFGEEVGLKI